MANEFYIHWCLVDGQPLEWCPSFVYCAGCHNSKKKDRQYIRAFCEKMKCEPLAKGVCLLCGKSNLTWDDVL